MLSKFQVSVMAQEHYMHLKINNNIKPTLDAQRDPASNRKRHRLTDRI